MPLKIKYPQFREAAHELLQDGHPRTAADIIDCVPMRMCPTRNQAASVLRMDPRFTSAGLYLWTLANLRTVKKSEN
jgi:hypothetical protein